jgi:glyoxylase-like metal-dependent hydrolase (beta-lactamase superfamily II)
LLIVVKSPLIEHFIVTALQQRCSVVTDPEDGTCVIIDGGGEAERIISWLDQHEGSGPDAIIGDYQGERNVVALLNTHAHFDHSGHIPYLLARYEVKWHLHADDAFLQSTAQSAASRWGFTVPEPARADIEWKHEDIFSFNNLSFEIIHTPGHTLGGCCLKLTVEDGADHLFVGDTLFQGSIGRTDLPDSGGDMDLLLTMIRERLWPLPEDTIVHPGHGPLTTIGHEKETNPYVNGQRFGHGSWL